MRWNETWKRSAAVVLGIVATTACESRTEVGSACPEGVCPQTLSQQSCQFTSLTSEFAVDGPFNDTARVCLPRPLATDEDGRVACKVRLDFEAQPDAGSPCDAPYLDLDESAPANDTCLVRQLSAAERDAASAEGWFYQTDAYAECATGLSITFTSGVVPDTVLVTVDCASVRTVAADGGLVDIDAEECAAPVPGGASDVGAACLPEVVPGGTFADQETVLETGSAACAMSACLVYRLRGNPAQDCVAAPLQPCATPREVERRAYCSCRCDGPAEEGPFCECPEDFSCIPALDESASQVRGSYCVRNGTFTVGE